MAYVLRTNCSLLPIGSVVGSSGLEPPTSRLSGARSNQLSYEPILSFSVFSLELWPFGLGGDEQNRTVDPLLARQVLSQLSYTPKVSSGVSFSASQKILFQRPSKLNNTLRMQVAF